LDNVVDEVLNTMINPERQREKANEKQVVEV